MRILIILLFLTGCSAKSLDGYDPTTSVITQFMKVLGSGDTSEIKGKKGKDNEKEWEKIDE